MGDEEDQETIRIDGSSLRVRRNLWSFLRHTSRLLRGIPLWIDAISIDQSDDEERSQQVRLMGQIYANAEKVLVWLGEGDETISRLFQHFDQYHIGEILSVISMSGRSIDGCLGKAEISGFPSAQAIDELIRYPATLAHTAWHRSLTLRPSSNTPATLIRRRELFQDESAQIISIKLHKHLLDHYQARFRTQ